MTTPTQSWSLFKLASHIPASYLESTNGKPPLGQSERAGFFALQMASTDAMLAMQSPAELNEDIQLIVATKGKLSLPQRSAAEAIVAAQQANQRNLSDTFKKNLQLAQQVLRGASTQANRNGLFNKAPSKSATSAARASSNKTIAPRARRGK